MYRKVVTDEEGRFQIKLKAGTTYCFVEDWKGEPFQAPQNTEFVSWDIACLKDRYSTPDFILAVKKSKNPVVKITYHKPCFYRPYWSIFGASSSLIFIIFRMLESEQSPCFCGELFQT
ncbi:MAG: hypothetical protein HWD58_05985 [Bacteroidota bacterium]|nr:MAG: hypothetical protein HWD58_05985 [Bacteroidota bacterium]